MIRLDMSDSCLLSECGQYRYFLGRTEPELPGRRITFVMLNPSTADATTDDPTIRRCRGFARREGFGLLAVINLFAYRATQPADLFALESNEKREGPRNEEICKQVLKASDTVVVAWGANVTSKETLRMLGWIREAGKQPVCLGRTRGGQPRHPLYVSAQQPLIPYDTDDTLFTAITGFDLMEREPGESRSAWLRRNVKWIRDHGEDVAQQAERAFGLYTTLDCE